MPEDQQLIAELQSLLMEGKLAQTTPEHILAASPAIRKDLVEKLQACRVYISFSVLISILIGASIPVFGSTSSHNKPEMTSHVTHPLQ
jgi:hypothetical protein